MDNMRDDRWSITGPRCPTALRIGGVSAATLSRSGVDTAHGESESSSFEVWPQAPVGRRGPVALQDPLAGVSSGDVRGGGQEGGPFAQPVRHSLHGSGSRAAGTSRGVRPSDRSDLTRSQEERLRTARRPPSQPGSSRGPSDRSRLHERGSQLPAYPRFAGRASCDTGAPLRARW